MSEHWLPRLPVSQEKIIRLTKQNCHLLPELLFGWQDYLQKHEKIQIRRSWTLTLDTRAEICKYIYIYLHFVKSLKSHVCYNG
jgi:hypothetical protein